MSKKLGPHQGYRIPNKQGGYSLWSMLDLEEIPDGAEVLNSVRIGDLTEGTPFLRMWSETEFYVVVSHGKIDSLRGDIHDVLDSFYSASQECIICMNLTTQEMWALRATDTAIVYVPED